jgi:hypothetical protein
MTYLTPRLVVLGQASATILGHDTTGSAIDSACDNVKIATVPDCHSMLEAEW